MTNKELFNHILAERACIRSRETCSKDCADCRLFTDLSNRDDAFSQVLEILKAREPELYFVDQINQLNQLMEDNVN